MKGHLNALHEAGDEAPAAAVVWPAGHDTQRVLDMLLAYVPIGQGVQVGPKLVAEMVPGEQRVRPLCSS